MMTLSERGIRSEKGNVFLVDFRPIAEGHGPTWVLAELAKANPANIITCAVCPEPATVLGYGWPTFLGTTRCDTHRLTTIREIRAAMDSSPPGRRWWITAMIKGKAGLPTLPSGGVPEKARQ